MAVAANRGTGGSVLDAQYGSSSTSNTNEPLLLTHTGTNYLYTSGVTGNFASTPHSSALDITGDIDIRLRVALDNWSTSATFASKGYVHCWWFYLSATAIYFAPTLSGGTVFPGVTWSSRPANGTTIWLRVTRVASTGVITWFSAADSADVPTSWTTIGTTTSTAGNLLSNPSMSVGIGAAVQNPSASFLETAGKFYRTQILSGIDGTVVFDANFATGITSGGQTTFTESSSNAATVTINRSTSGRKSVAVVRPVWLLGTDDYFEVADNDLLDFSASDSFTVVAVVRQWGTPTNFGRYVDKSNLSDTGWQVTSSGTSVTVYAGVDDGPNSVNRNGLSTFTAGAVKAIGMIVDRSAQTLATFAGSTLSATTSTAAVGSLANAFPMRIGVNAAAATVNQDFECLAVAVFRRALTATEIASIAAFYGAV